MSIKNIYIFLFSLKRLTSCHGDWGLGIGDWG